MAESEESMPVEESKNRKESVLSSHDDPFAPREGEKVSSQWVTLHWCFSWPHYIVALFDRLFRFFWKILGKTLVWKDVNMTLTPRSADEAPKRLLENVWGEVPKQETTAIMGPSGAGKTSM